MIILLMVHAQSVTTDYSVFESELVVGGVVNSVAAAHLLVA